MGGLRGVAVCAVIGGFAVGATQVPASGDAGAGAAAERKATALATYCSPSGDYCTEVVRKKGRIKLEIHTFSFKGKYRLCVAGGGEKQCKKFKLKRGGGLWNGRVDWKRKFGDTGAKHYRASWHKFGNRLGDKLKFKP